MGAVTVNILIADDSRSVRTLLRSYIEENSEWKISGEAENGEDAIEKVKTLRPDVVILDWLMPVMSGLEAARQIAKLAPKTPMLMLTLHRSNQLVKEAAAVGINHVFSKSEKLADLMRLLKDYARQG